MRESANAPQDGAQAESVVSKRCVAESFVAESCVSERFSEYTDKVVEKLRWKKVRPLVREELEAHLAESAQERGDAAAMAAMGAPEQAGERLNALYKPRVDVLLLVGTAAMLGFAAFVMAPQMLGKWALCATLAVAIGAAFALLDVRTLLHRYGRLIYAAGALALFCILIFMPIMNGARRSNGLTCAGMLLCCCGIGAFLCDGRDLKRAKTWLALLALTALPLFYVFHQPSFTMCVIFGFGLWAAYYRSKLPRAFVWGALVFALVCVVFLMLPSVMRNGYHAERVRSMFAPWRADPHGAGFVWSKVSEAWAGARWLGGVAWDSESVSFVRDWLFLPQIAATVGKLPAFMAIAANILVCWRMFAISRKLADPLSSVVSFGVSAYMAAMSALGIFAGFGAQFEMYMMFLTSSGSLWLFQAACVSLVFALNLNRDYIRLSSGTGTVGSASRGRKRLRVRLEWTE